MTSNHYGDVIWRSVARSPFRRNGFCSELRLHEAHGGCFSSTLFFFSPFRKSVRLHTNHVLVSL